MGNYFLNNFAADQPIAKYNAAILCYVQQTNPTPQQISDNLITKTCKVEDLYDNSTLSDAFIEGFDASIVHSLIAFQEESLLYVQKELKDAPETKLLSVNPKKPYHWNPWHNQKPIIIKIRTPQAHRLATLTVDQSRHQSCIFKSLARRQ